jgi:hypothetical protein
MQRSGGGAVSGEINVNSRRPLIPNVRPLSIASIATDPLSDSSPDLPHRRYGTAGSGSRFRVFFLRAACVYGLFVNFWYLGAATLYFLVFGDDSTTIGLYPIIPSAIAAVATVWLIRNKIMTMYIVAGLTAPLGLFVAYNVFRFGLI